MVEILQFDNPKTDSITQ